MGWQGGCNPDAFGFRSMGRATALLIGAFCLAGAPGCASLARSATSGMAANISAAILDQDDPATVRDGAPAYLLMLDGLIAGDPQNEELLLAGARLYGAYASSFAGDPLRGKRLSERARGYGQRALCAHRADLCQAVERPLPELRAALTSMGPADLPAVYGFATASATWIQANAGDWRAVADLPKVEALIGRVVELDDAHAGGTAHLYLGVLQTQRPASLGGQPEQGRAHFERAIELSGGRDLMAKVLFARYYARLVFDRPLHDRLLGEVVQADPRSPGLTLSNTLAQEEAQKLLGDADEYF